MQAKETIHQWESIFKVKNNRFPDFEMMRHGYMFQLVSKMRSQTIGNFRENNHGLGCRLDLVHQNFTEQWQLYACTTALYNRLFSRSALGDCGDYVLLGVSTFHPGTELLVFMVAPQLLILLAFLVCLPRRSPSLLPSIALLSMNPNTLLASRSPSARIFISKCLPLVTKTRKPCQNFLDMRGQTCSLLFQLCFPSKHWPKPLMIGLME